MDRRRRAATYSNPALGMAFENLADAFGPPSAQDVYAYTRAGSERQKAQRLSDLYELSKNPNADRRVLDQLNAATNNYAPTAGWIALETKDATDRHKIAVDDARGRADFASRDATSRANNADDNKRALGVAIMAPTPKDAVVIRPPEIADAFNVPRYSTGIIATQPGEISHVPQPGGGYSKVEGAPKPMTTDEWRAAQLQKASPEVQAGVAANDLKLTDVIMGDKTVPMTGPQRLAAGAPAAPKDPAQPQNYKRPDGSVGMFVVRNGKAYDIATQQELPPGTVGQSLSAAQGKEGALSDPTTANRTEANQLDATLNTAQSLVNEYRKLLQNNPGIVGLPAAVRGTAQDLVSVVQEFSTAFGNTPMDALITPDEAKALATRVGAGHRDPAIAQARLMQSDLAYSYAQMQNPRGEVSRQAYERALDALSGGTLRNNAAALEALTGVDALIARKRQAVPSLRQPGGPPTAPTSARQRARNPATGAEVEWTGSEWVPVK